MQSLPACSLVLLALSISAANAYVVSPSVTSCIHSLQMQTQAPNPVIKVASAGMGLLKPIFVAEAKLQAAVLGKIFGVSIEDVKAEITQESQQNKCLIYTYKLSPFSTEALSLLESSGFEYKNIELGLEWFLLGGRGSQTRVALADMAENGASSLPKIFIGGKLIGGAGGYSALASLIDNGEFEGRMTAARVPKKA
jgi:hypothetical protein